MLNKEKLYCKYSESTCLFCSLSLSLSLSQVGLLNSENEDFVKKMVETTQDNFQQVPEEIESVMVGIEAYLSIKRHNSDTGLSFFEDDDESGSDVVEKDFLEDLWGRIQVLCGNGWKVDSVPRPHLFFEAQLVAGKTC